MIAPLLIIQRVANRGALTSNTIITGHTNPSHARSWGESAGGDRVLPAVFSMHLADNHTKNAGEPRDRGVESTIDLNQDKPYGFA